MSVVVPFYGRGDDAVSLLSALGRLALAPHDELFVVDNTPAGAVPEPGPGDRHRRLTATAEQSSYHARNVGAEAAMNEWLLFLDSDCRPAPDLLERYFATPLATEVGIVSGAVRGSDSTSSMLARYADSRQMLDSGFLSNLHDQPVGVTANLLVRRDAWAAVGGFQEGIRSHGDSEFCWRVQDAGWGLIHDEDAPVEHAHRETLRALFRQCARYGAGAAWLNRHRPGSCPTPRPIRGLARCAAGVIIWVLTLQFERAAFKAIDAVSISGTACGYLLSNTPPGRSSGRAGEPADLPARASAPRTLVMVDSFPKLSETFVVEEVRALMALGVPVRVEAIHRPERPNRGVMRELRADFVEDDGILRSVAGAAWLWCRHPVRSLRDLATRRRWPSSQAMSLIALGPVARRAAREGDRHLHAHFACTSAVSAARLSELLDVPYSVTAHAFDIFKERQALPQKLDAASFVTSGCDYNVRHLREQVLNADSPAVVHKVIMGVDGERFRRQSPVPSEGPIVAIGRLVEKKGFHDLIRAAADPALRDLGSRIVIVGEGPERPELERLVAQLRVSPEVELVGWRDPGQIRDLLEGASVLVMPAIVAKDGDRDSMPVVVKEALAMEVPVVATDEVGLPEVVQDGWGRLVPPADPGSLARAIADVVTRDPEERAAMGRAGREFVLRNCSVLEETRQLARLIDEAHHQRDGQP
ncbi:MAG: glycosyltransferase [Solirubrobacterales bacterium]|nr:glycosyltransferase [Solirubrobacterales bacterium]